MVFVRNDEKSFRKEQRKESLSSIIGDPAKRKNCSDATMSMKASLGRSLFDPSGKDQKQLVGSYNFV